MSFSIEEINRMDREKFVRKVGPVFEHSSWIADLTWEKRPFSSVEILRQCMCELVKSTSRQKHLDLIRAHPDLVGNAVLTLESQGEQAAAGLQNLSLEEVRAFYSYNRAYKEKFGFPFVICARLNKKEAILAAFPIRLNHDAEQEVNVALGEIYKIAALRLHDLINL